MGEEQATAGEGGEYRFDFLGDRLCLDFVNTVSGMRLVAPVERLHGYPDLVSWAVQRGVLGEADAVALRQAAERDPAAASGVLRRALELREALFRLFNATLEKTPPASADLALLNAELSRALGHRRVLPGPEGLGLGWEPSPALDRVLWPVVEDAAELIASTADLARVRICEATSTEGCGWLFYDTTKGRTRRWCSMNACGNRAKARRHYARMKGRSQG